MGMARLPANLLVGLASLCIASIFTTGNIAMSKLVNQWQLPFMRLAGTGALFVVFAIILGCLLFSRSQLVCDRKDIKWVLLRGFFGSMQFILAIVARLMGAGVGDISAIMCINTVVAAIVGRIFLGESLTRMHIASI